MAGLKNSGKPTVDYFSEFAPLHELLSRRRGCVAFPVDKKEFYQSLLPDNPEPNPAHPDYRNWKRLFFEGPTVRVEFDSGERFFLTFPDDVRNASVIGVAFIIGRHNPHYKEVWKWYLDASEAEAAISANKHRVDAIASWLDGRGVPPSEFMELWPEIIPLLPRSITERHPVLARVSESTTKAFNKRFPFRDDLYQELVASTVMPEYTIENLHNWVTFA